MRPNHVLNAWRNNQATIGGWISIDSTFSVEVMAHAGFDWLCLDMQHGMLDFLGDLTSISINSAVSTRSCCLRRALY